MTGKLTIVLLTIPFPAATIARRNAVPAIYGMGIGNLILLRMEDIPGYQASMERELNERK